MILSVLKTTERNSDSRSILAISVQTALIVLIVSAGILLSAVPYSSIVNAQALEINPDNDPRPHFKMVLIDRSIPAGGTGHIQIVVVVPGNSESAWQGEIEVVLPDYIHATSATDGPSGGSRNLIIPVQPIKPGRADPYDIFLKADPELELSHPMIIAHTKMWPVSEEPEEDRDRFDKMVTRTLVEYGHVKPVAKFHCTGELTQNCSDTEESSTLAPCTEIHCHPWGKFLYAYGAIAGSLMAITTLKHVKDRY